ncbi:MAG: hypothetical protein QW607_12140 [Desulfurococcaceae archaeon]
MIRDWAGRVWELVEDVYYWIKNKMVDKAWRNYKTWLQLAEEENGRWVRVRRVVIQAGEKQFLWWWLLLDQLAGSVLGVSFRKFIALLRIIRLPNVFLNFQSKFVVLSRMFSRCQAVLNGFIRLEVVAKVKASVSSVLSIASRMAIVLAKRIDLFSVKKTLFSKVATMEITVYNWWRNNTTWQALSDWNNGLWYRN